MNEQEPLPDETEAYQPAIEEGNPRITFVRVFGEVLVTLGILLLLFTGYKAFLQDNVVGTAQTNIAKSYQDHPERFIDPQKVYKPAQIFAQLYIPRFGPNWTRLVGEGTRWHPVLNEIGVGHYRHTAMPGEIGNFAVAAHRGGFGGSFRDIHRLKKGDLVYVKTNKFWYIYKYLQTKIVEPTDTSVIKAVPPELVGASKGGRYMTMTSCTPIFVNTQRIVVWLELEQKTDQVPPEMKYHRGK